jgi:hypothetical protein
MIKYLKQEDYFKYLRHTEDASELIEGYNTGIETAKIKVIANENCPVDLLYRGLKDKGQVPSLSFFRLDKKGKISKEDILKLLKTKNHNLKKLLLKNKHCPRDIAIKYIKKGSYIKSARMNPNISKEEVFDIMCMKSGEITIEMAKVYIQKSKDQLLKKKETINMPNLEDCVYYNCKLVKNADINTIRTILKKDTIPYYIASYIFDNYQGFDSEILEKAITPPYKLLLKYLNEHPSCFIKLKKVMIQKNSFYKVQEIYNKANKELKKEILNFIVNNKKISKYAILL